MPGRLDRGHVAGSSWRQSPRACTTSPARCSTTSASLVRACAIPAVRAIDRDSTAWWSGTASSTCRSHRIEPVARSFRLPRLRQQEEAHRSDRLEHLLARGHQQRVPGTDQLVHPGRRRAGHRAGHAHHGSTQTGGPARGVEGTTADGGLDDDGAPRQSGDQPVAGQEADPRRRAPGGRLRDDQADLGDVVDQAAMGRGVGTIGPTREHRHRGTPLPECTPVGRLVDSERRPGDDGPGLPGEDARRCRPRPSPVGGGGTRAHHRDRVLDGLVEPERTSAPQADRDTAPLVQVRSRGEAVQRRRPLRRPRARRTGPPSTPRARAPSAGSAAASRSARSSPSARSAACRWRSPSTVAPPSWWTASVSGDGRARRCGTAPPEPGARSPSRCSCARSCAALDHAECGMGRDALQQERGRPAEPERHVELLARQGAGVRRGRPPTTPRGAPARPRDA